MLYTLPAGLRQADEKQMTYIRLIRCFLAVLVHKNAAISSVEEAFYVPQKCYYDYKDNLL